MLTQKFFQVLEAVVYIALYSGGQPVSAKKVCSAQGLQPRHLEQIMQRLVREGILHGSRGPAGGYALAIERRRITASDIWRAVCLVEGCEEENISALQKAVIIPLQTRVKEKLHHWLSQITLEELCREAQTGTKEGKRPDFTI